jgi:GntR family transcriptional regulator, regulator for abcA and norABC
MNENSIRKESGGQGHRLFEQIYDYIWNRIERREWNEHDKLPSVRTLAQELGVHRLTVFRAYQLLKEKGKVYVKDKSGYYVHPHPNEAGHLPIIHTAPSPVPPPYQVKNHLSEIHRVPATYQFSEAVIDPNLLPNMYFSDYIKKVFDLYPKVLATYAPVQGDEELREALCRHFRRQHRFELTEKEVLITSGAQQAIDLVARMLIKPMDTVLIERPTYSSAVDLFRMHGAQLVSVDITPDGYNLDQVEWCMRQYKPRFFYMNPTFHNPTGVTIPPEQRKRLVELAEQYRCLLVDDDTAYDMYFEKEPPPPCFAYDTEGCVVYIRGYSKYVSPGLRIAAVVCRPELMKHLLTVKSLADNGTPLLNQKMFLHYFTSERLQQHLEKLRIALAIRRDIMEEELAGTGWKWKSPQGGLNLWLQLPDGIDAEVLLARCMEHSLSFVPGVICDPRRELSSWARLSYSFANDQLLRQGIRLFIDRAKTM